MKVQVEIGSDSLFGDISGAEMEVVTRVFGKLSRGRFLHQDGQDLFVAAEQRRASLKITTTDAVETSQKEVDAQRKESERANRASLVAAYFDLEPGDDSTDILKDLKNALYYHSFIRYDERDLWAFERSLDRTGTGTTKSLIFCKRDSTNYLTIDMDGMVDLK